MALMEWATNVPQKLLQCDAIHLFNIFNINSKIMRSKSPKKVKAGLLPAIRQYEEGIPSNR